MYTIDGELLYLEYTNYCKKLFNEDEYMYEGFIDSLKNFFSKLRDKLKSLWNKLKSFFTKKDDKLENIEKKVKENNINDKVTIPNLDKLESECKKNKKINQKIDHKKLLAAIGTVTVTAGVAITMIKKHKNRIQQNQVTTETEIENTLDDTEKEIEKKYELALIDNGKVERKIDGEYNTQQAKASPYYDYKTKMTPKEIRQSQEKLGFRRNYKDYYGAVKVTINNKIGSDQDIAAKTNERLKELKKWEQEQKTKCTGLVIDEYTIQVAELSVLESTIKELESEISKLKDAIDTNSDRKRKIMTIGSYSSDNGMFSKRSGKWISEPEINNKAYMFFFKIIHECLKINDNNIRDVKFINQIIDNINKIIDDLSENYKIMPHETFKSTLNFAHEMREILGADCKDLEAQEQKLQKLSTSSFMDSLKNSSKNKISYGFTDEKIFCSSCPFDWLKFCELDKEDFKKRRETIDEIDKINDKYENQLNKLTNTRDSLQDKASKKKVEIDKENKKKKEQQKQYDEVRKQNTEDIKIASGKNGFQALFNKIKKS